MFLKTVLSEDLYKEIHNQLINLSSRLKELDNKTPKRTQCSLQISKLLLKYFNIFNELNSSLDSKLDSDDRINELAEEEESDEESLSSRAKILTKQIVEKADRLTNSVPDQDIIGTMLLKKSKYIHDFLTRKSRF